MKNSDLISLHGGHSGEFCNHAENSLEEIIKAYIDRGFSRVGISEHIPPPDPALLFPEEKQAGLTPHAMAARFNRYMDTMETLKRKYRSRIHIFKGFETEGWTGYEGQVQSLIKKYQPDYIVGSIHHVNDQCFDYSEQDYHAIARSCGGVSSLYGQYFDRQYELIKGLTPFVVGHFDLIRIYDPDYRERVLEPGIQKKIDRNLALIKSLGLVMDLNLRPLTRGEEEPYPTGSILEKIRSARIPMVPGDDSHSAAQAGALVPQAIDRLKSMGFDTQWPLEKMGPGMNV